MEGPHHSRRDGTGGSRVVWGLGHKRPQHAKAQQAKTDKAARKQGVTTSAASAETQTHRHPTEEGEGSGEEPIVPRGPEWVDEHVRGPSPHTGPYYHRGRLVSNISGPHPAGDLSLVRPRWIAHPYHGQSQQSPSSRRSSGRARSGSDPTTSRSNRLPQVSLTSFSSHQAAGNSLAHYGGHFSDRLVSSSNDCVNPSWI